MTRPKNAKGEDVCLLENPQIVSGGGGGVCV